MNNTLTPLMHTLRPTDVQACGCVGGVAYKWIAEHPSIHNSNSCHNKLITRSSLRHHYTHTISRIFHKLNIRYGADFTPFSPHNSKVSYVSKMSFLVCQKKFGQGGHGPIPPPLNTPLEQCHSPEVEQAGVFCASAIFIRDLRYLGSFTPAEVRYDCIQQ